MSFPHELLKIFEIFADRGFLAHRQWRSQDFSEGEAIVTAFFKIWISETAFPAF